MGLPWDVARELAHAAAAPLPPVNLRLADAQGATLAVPLVSPDPLPPCDRAAMDGYAVRGAGPWRVVGRIRAGSELPGALGDGEAYTIVTGAAVPAGTTAVLKDEDATQTDAGEVHGVVRPGQHIRRAGEECAAGEELLPADVIVEPAVLGLAASLGFDELTVRRRPRVIALVTGDEITRQGRPEPGRIRDAIGPMLPGLTDRAGATLTATTYLTDLRTALIDALLTADAELVLVSGSSAAGPADHLRPALTALGAELVVDGVACRPGHPQTLARLADGRLVLGLPGNPFAALTAFLTLGVPVLRRLRALPLQLLPLAPVPGGITCHPTSTRLVPVHLEPHGAVPLPHTGSAMLRGAATAHALAVVEPGPSEAIAARLLPLDPGS